MDGFNRTFSSTTDALFSAERAALSFLPRSAKTMVDGQGYVKAGVGKFSR
jgi:hypothetical protein